MSNFSVEVEIALFQMYLIDEDHISAPGGPYSYDGISAERTARMHAEKGRK